MKRDARIGLAVVLVLGLSVTLLVARALNKRAATSEAEEASNGKASPTNLAENAGPASNEPTEPFAQSLVQAQDQALKNFNADHSGMTPAASLANSQGTRAEVVDEALLTASHPLMVGGGAGQSEITQAHDAGKKVGDGVAPHTPAAPGWTYTATAGDTAAKISAKVFGDAKYASKIGAANRGLGATHIKAGQKVHIPVLPGLSPKISLPAVTAKASAHTEPGHAQPRELEICQTLAPAYPEQATLAATYVVKSGDTVAAIARAQYGAAGPKAIQRILDANPGLEPKRLRIGASLKIPAPLP